MKNLLSTLAAAVLIWIGLNLFGPELLKQGWLDKLRPTVVMNAPTAPAAKSSAPLPALPFTETPVNSPANPGSLNVSPGRPADWPTPRQDPLTPSDNDDPASALPTARPEESALPVDRPEVLNAVVTITGDQGAGTGFLCTVQGKIYVATNQHVLAVGNPLTLRANTGATIAVRRVFAATDADIALLEPAALPPGAAPLIIATLPDAAIRQQNPTLVPGNSKGDGVITQTKGRLLAVGPQRIEVNNPVYPGNSGSPILDVPTGKVIGVLTEVEKVTLNEFERASFRSGDSAIKSDVRYFGHRLDSVQGWEPLNWATYQETEAMLKQSRAELLGIVDFLSASSNSYKSQRELRDAISHAENIFRTANESLADKVEAYQRFFQDLERIARRAKTRLDGRKIYYQQREKVDTINRLASAIMSASLVAKRDTRLAETILGRKE